HSSNPQSKSDVSVAEGIRVHQHGSSAISYFCSRRSKKASRSGKRRLRPAAVTFLTEAPVPTLRGLVTGELHVISFPRSFQHPLERPCFIPPGVGRAPGLRIRRRRARSHLPPLNGV